SFNLHRDQRYIHTFPTRRSSDLEGGNVRMSWFDKLFGEENDPNKDYLNKRNQRRQKSQEHQDTLLPQNNDVYERPKGKFRFPMRVLEENSETEDAINGKSENEFK